MSNLDPEIEVDDAAEGGAGGGTAQAVLEYVVRHIVDEPDAISVEVEERRRGIELHLNVAPEDMGKVIGRRGRVVQAMRTVVRAAGAREGVEANVTIDD
ncbi:MAG TPA: KH domain-containing protein [Acidimicrobiales bacterium]|nr:KH domain-containing protein [Acidimicrobiales bacterium]